MELFTYREDAILDFINRRFGKDKNTWLDGNCYYFALILKDRFPGGDIYYDPILGHFVYKVNNKYFDAGGKFIPDNEDKMFLFSDYAAIDSIHYDRILRDCVR